MKNIRITLVATLTGISAFTGMARPVYAQKLFTDQTQEQKHTEASTPVAIADPELKKVLPLAFVDTKTEDTQPSEDISMFATPFVEQTAHISTNKPASTEKVMPIASDDVVGISTFFTRFHPGIDLRAPVGTPIRAILPGVVNEVGFEKGGYGKYIVLVHHVNGKTYFSLYAHMKETKVSVGDDVNSGTVIGEVGLTGHTTGAHLHFEIHTDNQAIDPLAFFTGKSLASAKK